MEITVGSKVRSFDFHHMRDLEGPRSCYMEGVVTGIENIGDCDRYVIEVTRCVVGGEEKEIHSPVIIPPVNGTPTTMGRITDGVEAI